MSACQPIQAIAKPWPCRKPNPASAAFSASLPPGFAASSNSCGASFVPRLGISTSRVPFGAERIGRAQQHDISPQLRPDPFRHAAPCRCRNDGIARIGRVDGDGRAPCDLYVGADAAKGSTSNAGPLCSTSKRITSALAVRAGKSNAQSAAIQTWTSVTTLLSLRVGGGLSQARH